MPIFGQLLFYLFNFGSESFGYGFAVYRETSIFLLATDARESQKIK